MIHSSNTITAHLTSNQMLKSIQQQESKTRTHFLLLLVGIIPNMLTQQDRERMRT